MRSARILGAIGRGAALAATLVATRPATAQLHWDAAAQVGVAKRFLVERPAGSGDAGIGPSAQLSAHVALAPLVRAGLWVGHDISPLAGDAAARDMTSFGVRAKLMSPWPRGAFRAWLFAGFGYTRVWARSYRSIFTMVPDDGSPSVPAEGLVGGASAYFFEVPFGISASYKFWKPWEVFAELGCRVGFGHDGRVYDDPGRPLALPGRPNDRVLPHGTDRFALGLSLGILLDL